MGNGVVYCSILLLLFVKVGPGLSSNIGVDDVLQLPGTEHREDRKHHLHGQMNSDPTSPGVKIFGFLKDIEVGNTRPFYFPHLQDPTSFEFFPEEQIRDIPFSSEALPQLLRFFSFSPDSPQAMAMKQTLELCESEPPKEEVYHCATSLESLLDFAHRVFGSDRITILRSPLVSNSTPPVQNYTVVESKEIWTGKMIPCHYQKYPYAVYSCHFDMVSRNKLFALSLRGDNGDTVNPVFICHLDTSTWDADHIAFRTLGVKPGESEVCHIMPAQDLFLLPK
ncbi:hypothetical protein HRI_003467400 [Hibiscus trionum]|uniref:BURP domain-containing protein n=1 Tax=Hibiscus trionum TaxID=183268 RepID=A0A9W7ILT5_HIBTR|nr:hypothetical protein HRI_003467400 [Hibiscus trionum]